MNKKNVVLNSIVAGVGLLTIIFMALDYITGLTGFNFLSLGEEAPLLMIGAIFTLLAGIVMLGTGVVNLLCSLNVIKNVNVAKSFKIIQLVAVIVALVADILVVVGLIVVGPEMLAYMGAGLILNTILAIGALVCGIIAAKSKK